MKEDTQEDTQPVVALESAPLTPDSVTDPPAAASGPFH
jgi:hypothetical protein